ncbi:hypothetical protein KTN05_07485 [Paracoccus sp. Z118]|uniref:hypothetical protein n=1 Tax=Paracoccus sp. Z118 TaxID=2851017 RepID=UPI001C2C7770|nr:hypothetical protein [Paracoccus sp. Z118]MBV0891694.1 hypothetical protein [Paracoccus sp. Z118]
MTRLMTPLLLAALFAAPLAAQEAERPVLRAKAGCEAGVKDAYTAGYLDGVEAVKAQLGQATARMQEQVQSQLNAQLRQMQQQSAAELDTRIAAAQEQALADQAAGAAVPPDTRMPSLAGTLQALDTGAARAAVQPSRPAEGDPAALPPGTSITITDPQNLPPELFRALMAYASR